MAATTVASRVIAPVSTSAARSSVSRSQFLAGRSLRFAIAPAEFSSRGSLVIRATSDKPAKVDRSGDTLWFASSQSLSYLDGT
ncbi:hypothetical protein CBR_g36898 [Chara braunii]|uniref:Uncharacterized protein n=1 Tax=Chara braunii TaxID=69332 RepID=A0A388LM23_CHABU|nr:hypothetical protein CBR_g36898 [Chara braunii]|eukprot:GBG83283.1 hypothetical protein CBR_g36898 [Chara braunii]